MLAFVLIIIRSLTTTLSQARIQRGRTPIRFLPQILLKSHLNWPKYAQKLAHEPPAPPHFSNPGSAPVSHHCIIIVLLLYYHCIITVLSLYTVLLFKNSY